jgi:predicted glutamine amidotransferase
MCRLFGCVAREPLSVRHELLEAENPLIHQSEEHDSGWGMAVYRKADGDGPRCLRFPEPAHDHDGFVEATSLTGRMFIAHVRRATMGGLAPENTHPFCLGPYAFCHNGTIIRHQKLLEPGVREPVGQTDSEVFFNFLTRDFDPEDARKCLRKDIRRIIERSPFSGLNFLFSDGDKLYAYKLGIFELYWAARPGSLVVSSERLTTTDTWHKVQDDVLLTLDPEDLVEPHAEHLVGESWVKRADIRPLDGGQGLRGEERGNFAAERAAKLAAETA